MEEDEPPATSRSARSLRSAATSAEIIEETVEAFAGEAEEPVIEIGPEEDVYSYMMFIGPTASIRAKGRINADTWVGFFLVGVTLFIQGYLLWAVFNSVITTNIDWEKGIVNAPGTEWALAAEVGEGCNTGASLCTLERIGEELHYSCAPPSVRLTSRWHELDTNGDGIWTREEVKAARAQLKCKYIVDPVEFFDVVQTFVLNREKIIWVHPDVRAGTGIAQPYFTYAAGDVIMCGYRDEKMCANVLRSGFFDAPLKYNTVPRVGNTIDSAMHYCRELLKPGGTCERTLPSTYSVWKVESDQECKGKHFSKFVFEHPKTGTKKSFLAVDYEARRQFEKVNSPLFKLYKTVIVAVWVFAMIFEVKKMIGISTWVYSMKSASSAREEGLEAVEMDPDSETYTINGITIQHRVIQGLVTIIRFFMILILFWVGTSLLLQSPEYMTLLFDAVSLKFIIELQEIFYAQILRQRVRDQTMNVNGMVVPAAGPTSINSHPGIKDFSWLLIVIVISVLLLHLHYENSVKPIGEGLECACLGVGDKCIEAQNFTYDFWHDYWRYKTPQVFKDVDALKAEVEQVEGSPQEAQAASTQLLQVNATLASLAKAPLTSIMRTQDHALRSMIVRHHSFHAGRTSF